jgi:uncharacterized Zn-finger protein
MWILLGIKRNCTGVGNTEDNYSSVEHQQTDVIASDNSAEELTKLYHAMIKKAEVSKKKLTKLNSEIEFSDMSENEYERLYCEYSAEIKILKYDKVMVVNGFVLK